MGARLRADRPSAGLIRYVPDVGGRGRASCGFATIARMVFGDETFAAVDEPSGEPGEGWPLERSVELVDPQRQSSEATTRLADEWSGRAAAYARGLAGVYAGAIGLVLDTIDERVPLQRAHLADVGCGTGLLAAAARERGARVSAIDPAPDMRELARRTAPDAQVIDGTAPELPLADGSIDVTTGHFLLEHAGDPRGALADLVRVTRPGGVVAVTIWAPDSALGRLWSEVAAESDAEPVRVHRMPDQFDFARTGTGLASLLDGAGLEHIDVHTLAWLAQVDADDLWAAPAAGIGELGRLLAGQDEQTVARAKRAYDRLTADRGELVCEAILAIGVRPQAA